MSLRLKNVVGIVDKNFKANIVVLVVPKTETIVLNKKPIVSQTIRIEKLITFAVASSVSTIHCEVQVLHLGIPPLSKLLKVFY